jgi:hypothetical protein
MSGIPDRPLGFGSRRIPFTAPPRRPTRFVPVDAPGRVIGPADQVFGNPGESPRDPLAARFHEALARILSNHRTRPQDAARIMDLLEMRARMSGTDDLGRTSMAEAAAGRR